jgi:hypothetical protein
MIQQANGGLMVDIVTRVNSNRILWCGAFALLLLLLVLLLLLMRLVIIVTLQEKTIVAGMLGEPMRPFMFVLMGWPMGRTRCS